MSHVELVPAKGRVPGPCDCDACRSLCLGVPGWFLPGQVTKAAEHLGLSVEEFFDRYLILEYWEGPPRIYVLAPRRVGQQAPVAKYAAAFDHGPCALLTEKGCRLPPDFRPAECLAAFRCSTHPYAWRPAAVPTWEKDPGELVQIRKHIGRG